MTDTSTSTAADTTATGTVTAAAVVDPAAASTDTAATTDTTTNPWADPEVAKAEIEKLRRENAADRTNAKTTAAADARAALAQELGKTLGLIKDDAAIDPAELTSQLTTTQADAKAARLELAVYKAAAGKADASALLDSRSFLEQVASIDPTDTAALEAAIATATTSNPRLKVSQAAAVGGADTTTGGGAVRTYTREQLRDSAFYQANKTDIQAALTEGRIRE